MKVTMMSEASRANIEVAVGDDVWDFNLFQGQEEASGSETVPKNLSCGISASREGEHLAREVLEPRPFLKR